MRNLPALVFLAAIIVPSSAVVASATDAAADEAARAAQRVRAHTTFLADDLMEGRSTGSRGFTLAARYVAAQFARLGLEPGADRDSFEQPIKFLETTTNREASRLVVHHGDKDDALTPVTEMFAAVAAGQTKDEITAPAVFVGFGVQAPDLGYDDYPGVDLKGKIAVILSGAPSRFPSEQRAHYAHTDQKRTLLVRHGAIGVITIMRPRDEARRPWAISAAEGRFPAMRLVDATGAVVGSFPQLRVSAAVSNPAAVRIFAGAPKTAEEVFAAAERAEPQSFPLNRTITLAGESTLRTAESVNVLGWLPGTDPTLAGEPIVITAHLDGYGMGAAVAGDTIYNGAVDNALGIGVTLHVAEALATGPRPRRPVLFAAVTGEEKGLLGARHLAAHPPARVKHYAANVNIDMPLLSAPAKNLIAYGAEHSSLGAILKTVSARHGLTVSPDPAPDEVRFVRSDQYPFVLKGVPAVKVDPGMEALDPAVDLDAAEAVFRKQHYHKPSDDLKQPIDWAAAGSYAVLMHDLIGEVANDPTAPAWLPGDFFGDLFGRKP